MRQRTGFGLKKSLEFSFFKKSLLIHPLEKIDNKLVMNLMIEIHQEIGIDPHGLNVLVCLSHFHFFVQMLNDWEERTDLASSIDPISVRQYETALPFRAAELSLRKRFDDSESSAPWI